MWEVAHPCPANECIAFLIIQALSQNAELRSRLNRIHSESVLTEQVVSVNIISTPDEVGHCARSVTDTAHF